MAAEVSDIGQMLVETPLRNVNDICLLKLIVKIRYRRMFLFDRYVVVFAYLREVLFQDHARYCASASREAIL
ncbi:hypothetical protein AUR63_07020 [Guyparkeria sp. XI15]|nr:hypothetical protein AUR63_07020 [Guyparkeria sp. XI15]OAE89569.1 hypothetical protein AWR35_07030 [Guyparkeria sp. WRN-7]